MRAMIVGAGMGGLFTALALRQAGGAFTSIDVYEHPLLLRDPSQPQRRRLCARSRIRPQGGLVSGDDTKTELPQPLRQFRSRSAAFLPSADAPAIAFPPDGAEVELLPDGLMVRVSGGKAPFTWLADGVPMELALRNRQAMLVLPGKGFVTLSVIDAEGRSARARLRLR